MTVGKDLQDQEKGSWGNVTAPCLCNAGKGAQTTDGGVGRASSILGERKWIREVGGEETFGKG